MGTSSLRLMLRGAALLAACALAAPAAAQLSRSNTDAPIDLTADELEVVNAQCLAIWRGSAEALQADSRLRADVLRIYSRVGPAKAGGGSSCGETDKMVAEGAVYYVTPSQRIRGDLAVYTKANDMLVVTGDVVAVQGKNVLRGKRMVMNVKTGQAQMENPGAKGRNTPGRVRGVFYPSDKSQSGGTGARTSSSESAAPAAKPVTP